MITAAQPYSGVLVRGARRPILNMMRRRGLGQTGSGSCISSADIRAAMPCAQYNSCDVRDEQCVACGQQCTNAVSNLVDSGCINPGTPISWSCDTSAAANYLTAGTPGQSNATVGTGSAAYVASGPTVSVQPPAFTGQISPAQMATCPSMVFTNGVCSGPRNSIYHYATQQQQANPVAQQTTLNETVAPMQPRYPQPPSPTVVNPSPATQLTATGSAYMSALSALSLANGTALTTTGQSAAAVSSGNWFTDPSQELISGLPNWALLVMGAGGLFMVVNIAARR